MATRLTPFGWFAKFVAIPAIVAGTGYWLVGPHVGKDFLRGKAPLLRRKVESALALAPQEKPVVPAADEDSTVGTAPAPSAETRTPSADVRVSVRPAREVEKFRPTPRTRRRKRKKPPTEATPTVDSGTGTGMTVVPPDPSPVAPSAGG